jgi:hypothetical protein
MACVRLDANWASRRLRALRQLSLSGRPIGARVREGTCVVVVVVEGLHVRSMLGSLSVRTRTKICGSHLIQIALRRCCVLRTLMHHGWDDHVVCREVNWRFSATLLASVTVETDAVVSLHLMLVVLGGRRRSEERRAVGRERCWEAKHHVIHGRAIVMVLMMLVIINVANVHIVAHGTS